MVIALISSIFIVENLFLFTYIYLKELALSFPETIEKPHFEKTSFKVNNKIFATYDEKLNRACIKLSEMDQDAFSLLSKSCVYPVPYKWGKQGWPLIEMSMVEKNIFIDAFTTAYFQDTP